MKLILCGKGGSGKSTIASLLSQCFAEKGKKVLVVDTDESNFGLHRQLGLELPQDFTNYFGGKSSAFERIMQSSPNFESVCFFEKEWTLDSIPSPFFSEKDGVRLVSIGKIHEVGEGCACTMGIVTKQFISNLALKDDEVVIIDTEAGIEHFGRAVEESVDAILMIIDPSFESLRLSEKVSELSQSVNKPVYFVLNKVSADNEAFMRKSIHANSTIAAVLPADSRIMMAGLQGDQIQSNHPEINGLYEFLSKNAGKTDNQLNQ